MMKFRPTQMPVKAFAIAVFVLIIYGPVTACAKEELKRDQVSVVTHDGAQLHFNVELALTPDQQKVGLMNRTYMAEDEGMLFIFDTEGRRGFWMKDTLIPLDMLFIGRDGEIHHIHHMARPQDESRITSEWPVKAVLEINGGMADRLGIAEGDKVLHPVFRNILAE